VSTGGKVKGPDARGTGKPQGKLRLETGLTESRRKGTERTTYTKGGERALIGEKTIRRNPHCEGGKKVKRGNDRTKIAPSKMPRKNEGPKVVRFCQKTRGGDYPARSCGRGHLGGPN